MLIASVLVLLSLAVGSNAQCSASYAAPYQLSQTPTTLTVDSAVFENGRYHIQPCGGVDASLCPYSVGQQQCFATTTWELVSDGLGDKGNTAWKPNGADWSAGAIAENTDIAYDYDQCNADPSTNMFRVTYFCGTGNDAVTIVTEPTDDKNGPCTFEFRVDSSIVCAGSGGGSSGGGSTGGGSTGTIPTSTGEPAPGPDSSKKGGLSGGWIFTIILIVVFTVYLFGGIAWNRMRKGLSGAEMIPNRDFWAGLPGLVKDGCVFFAQKCKSLCNRGGGGGEKSTTFM